MKQTLQFFRQEILTIAISSLGVFMLASAGTFAYLLLSYLPQQQSQISHLLSQVDNSFVATEKAFNSTKNELRTLEKKNSASVALAAEMLAQSSPNISAVVTEWSPVVSLVSCTFLSENGEHNVQSGSGMLVMGSEGSVEVWTNRHVLQFSGRDGKMSSLTGCTLSLSGNELVVNSGANNIFVDEVTDFGQVSITHPTKELRSIASKVMPARACKKEAVIGEEVVILGYPTIGSESGITVTEGIIAGVEGEYYVTSAKIEHGNSGGIAVSVEKNCYLGIPSFVKSGALESLGRILKWQVF